MSDAADGAPRLARATYLGFRTLATAMRLAPEPVVEVAADAVAAACARWPSQAAAQYRRHLRRVLGEEPSPAARRRWLRLAFQNYARYWAEGARLPDVAPGVVRDRMRMESGFEHLQRAVGQGRGAIVALPHVGSWEWGGAWLALEGYPMTAVAEPLQPPELYRWFVAQREAIGLTIVALGPGAGGVLLRTLRAGGVVGLLCDRDLLGTGVEVEFFGERTTLPAGPATLALRTGAALLPTAVYSGPGRMHTAVVQPPLPTDRRGGLRADVTRVTQDLAHALEALIRRAPEQWHLFQPNWPSDRGVARTDAGAS